MTFAVKPEDLVGYAKMLDGGVHDEVYEMRSLLHDGTMTTTATFRGKAMYHKGDSTDVLPANSGNALAIIAASHRDFQRGADTFVTAMDRATSDAALGLSAMSIDYRATDDDNAEAIESVFPGEVVARNHLATKQDADPFTYQDGDYGAQQLYGVELAGDHFDFQQYLPQPGSASVFGADVSLSLLSESNMVAAKDFAKKWLEIDVDRLIGIFDGDWNTVLDASHSVDQIAARATNVAANVRRGNTNLDVTWDGAASEVAYQFFSAHAGNIEGQNDNLTDLARLYRDTADDIGGIAKAAAGNLSLFLDEVGVISDFLPADPGKLGVTKENGKWTLDVKDLAVTILTVTADAVLMEALSVAIKSALDMWTFNVYPLGEAARARARDMAATAADIHTAITDAAATFGHVDTGTPAATPA
ncbi:MAG TPA: hypothetical protein VE172_14810 [Stackebrandtia sp.]|uniref:hypothetical protein n=1 Tax=Stackebrandtia sp. TaxID=2023065 RepID=UPI002D30E354|nr:hypothetical protein [Stackebrandtia sp.]HZE40075.1 hypothetical protein [Stackebrandtia sp.]